MTEHSIRHLARALAIGAVAALVIDAALRNALEAVQSPAASSMTPWWVVGRVVERGVWVVAALLVWFAAGAMSHMSRAMWPARPLVSRADALQVIGYLMIVGPVVWFLATAMVLGLRITLAGNWSLDGQMFLTSSFYNSVVLGYLPWAGAGVTLLALSRHTAPE